MIEYKDFTWKNKYNLYLGDTYIGKVFNAEEDCWWVEWADGTISADYYNLSRAKDNLIKHTMRERNNGGPRPNIE